MRWWQICLILGLLLSACGGNGGGPPSKGNHANVIYVGADTQPKTGTGTATSTVVTPDAGANAPADSGSGGQLVGDALAGAPWTADQIFPSCAGTTDQVSDCIMNLPSKFGVPVTSAAPMDFNACKP